MVRLIKTKVPGLMKDSDTGAFINTNEIEYQQNIREMKRAKDLKHANEQILSIREELTELKKLFKAIEQHGKYNVNNN